MKEKKETVGGGPAWHFMQAGGLVQLKIQTIADVLHLADLDQKLWVALACPVQGLEFSEETLALLDTDKNGRVRAPEILEAVAYIKTYFKKPEVIMEAGDCLPAVRLRVKQPVPCWRCSKKQTPHRFLLRT